MPYFSRQGDITRAFYALEEEQKMVVFLDVRNYLYHSSFPLSQKCNRYNNVQCTKWTYPFIN